jgi:hypothetical protein
LPLPRLAPQPCQDAGSAAATGGLKLDAEIRHRIRNLPEALWLDRKYRNPLFWYDFLAWEHTARRRTTCHDDF